MSNHRVRVLYHPRQNVMGLWRDRDFPYLWFSLDPSLKGWNVWIKLKFARERGWVVICELDSSRDSK